MEGFLDRESLGDASTIRLGEVSKALLVREILGRQDRFSGGMYNREGDA